MKENIRLVQLYHREHGRKVAIVEGPSLFVLNKFKSVYALAKAAIDFDLDITYVINDNRSQHAIIYDTAYHGLDGWSLLPSFDNPNNPFACLVSGTGLTHKNSALNRQMMHQEKNDMTDSMKMYQLGVEGGQPGKGKIGNQPEWFYKGTGNILTAHGKTISIPAYANDGGEEPEIAGVYIISKKGKPYRVGFTTANEFSDHVMEKKNYLYLAPSKLRNCALGPELVINGAFSDIEGTVKIIRDKKEIWSAKIRTGEKNMAHSLANLEHHHFKYSDHCQPYQAHVHFFGADAFSFGAGIKLETGDEMIIHWKGMGRPLINSISIESGKEKLTEVCSFQQIH
jgi:hypothetical protein